LRNRWLRLIALFKFVKTVLLIGVGLGALRLLNPAIAAGAQQWATTLADSSDRRFLEHLLAQVAGLPPASLDLIALGAFLYAGLFIIEGTGLWLGRRWAEYLTVVATASLLPIEILELLQGLTIPRAMALMLNFLVVAYLIYRLRRSRSPFLGWGSSSVQADRFPAGQLGYHSIGATPSSSGPNQELRRRPWTG
jgi:uncharacterized membrane protein (DUF2068 family)